MKPLPSAENLPLPSNKDHFEEYERLTKANDWAGIFSYNNGMSVYDGGKKFIQHFFGTRKELNVLPDYLSDGEVVFALVTGVMEQTGTSNTFDFGTNTWLCALTNKRILFLDHAMLSTSVDTQTIRHDSIQAVSASQGFVFGKVIIDIGSRSVIIDNCFKSTVKIFAKLANDWLEKLSEPITTTKTQADGPMEELKKLGELKANGILDEEEFAAAKAKILSKM